MVKKKGETGRSLRQDFEVFAKGVERLEELRAELNSLNTKGHEEEVASIRSKLKNVSYIPEIEEEIRILKTKINGKYRRREEKRSGLSDPHIRINKKIKELEEEVKKKRRVVGSKEIAKIPKLEGQINYLKSILKKQQEDEDRKKELLKKIDPNVNLLINTRFDMTLNEVKAELSKKIKAR